MNELEKELKETQIQYDKLLERYHKLEKENDRLKKKLKKAEDIQESVDIASILALMDR